MTLFRKILVPVDGSSISGQALDLAIALAREHHGQLRALHVIDELGYLSSYEYAGELLATSRRQGLALLEKTRQAAAQAEVPIDTRLVDQPGQRLGQTVADEAATWGADLVVVGSHGRRGVGRELLGSGAEQIVRLSSVPVLTVRGNGG